MNKCKYKFFIGTKYRLHDAISRFSHLTSVYMRLCEPLTLAWNSKQILIGPCDKFSLNFNKTIS